MAKPTVTSFDEPLCSDAACAMCTNQLCADCDEPEWYWWHSEGNRECGGSIDPHQFRAKP